MIWRIFIEFEIRAKELGRAKKLLYRAIGDCPIVKGAEQAMCLKFTAKDGSRSLSHSIRATEERI